MILGFVTTEKLPEDNPPPLSPTVSNLDFYRRPHTGLRFIHGLSFIDCKLNMVVVDS